ncbi:hypothetical protein DXG01_012988, partial [Tephrocybe rancida]
TATAQLDLTRRWTALLSQVHAITIDDLSDEEAEDEDRQDPLLASEVTDVPTRIFGSVPTAFYDTLTSLTEGGGGYEDDADDLSLPLAH